jgi:hypothetical protein
VGLNDPAPGWRRHGAKLNAVQLDRRAHSKMIAAEHRDTPFELILNGCFLGQR